MDPRLLLLALASLAGGTEGAVAASLLPGMAADLGVTIAQAGYVVFGYSLAYAIGTPILATALAPIDAGRCSWEHSSGLHFLHC